MYFPFLSLFFVAIEVKKNSSEYGIDDDSISEMIGQSGSSHVNKTAFLIEDKGVDKIDVPISGSTNWNTLIHGTGTADITK